MARKSDPDFKHGDGDVAGVHSKDMENEETAPVMDERIRSESGDSGGGPNDSEFAQPVDDEALEPGFVLNDRFEILALVHSGGMGHVYKAIDRRRHHDSTDQIHVAIKMMRRSVASDREASIALEREAASAQRLSHPNIVNIYDFDRHDEQFYLVMEWLDGESLTELLKRTRGQRLAREFAWQIIEGVASGLEHAHSNDIVHADINPSNIFITDTQQIKLLDFGVARVGSDSEADEADDDRFAWATRSYASPEVLSGSKPVFEDDIFSLGCVAYRVLSGTPPFAGWSSLDAKEARAAVQPVPGISEINWQTLSRALSYERRDRPSTASVFSEGVPITTGFGRKSRRLSFDWWLIAPALLIPLLAGIWWMSPGGSGNETQDVAATISAVETPGDLAAASDESSELDGLLLRAAQAMVEERYISPADDNARRLFLDALKLDPSNSTALGGLRTISDKFLQQTNAALRADDPAEAVALLAIAGELDPQNPAVAIVNELLIGKGDAELANARLAAAEGDADRAEALLSKAELYAHIDATAIDAVRSQLAQSEEELQFLDRLAAANAYIDDGRLIAPAGNNAHGLLLELYADHPDDARLLASMERLGGRLLTRAAFASATDRVPEAIELLDAADTLGVLSADVAAARRTLLDAEESAPDTEVAAAQSAPPQDSVAQTAISDGDSEAAAPAADTAVGLAALPAAYEVAAEPAPAEATVQAAIADGESEAVAVVGAAEGELAALPVSYGNVTDPTGTEAQDLAVPTTVSTGDSDIAALIENATGELADLPVAENFASDPALANDTGSNEIEAEPSEPRTVSLSELDIENYVAPEFPRRAARRGVTGSVDLRFSVFPDGSTGAIEIMGAEPGDIFVSSAENAVMQWRFAPPGDEVRARVTLRFEQQP